MSRVTEHLHVCGDCSRSHEALKSLIIRMGNIRPVEAPDDLLEKINDRIKGQSILDRLREALSFRRIGFPVELAAFAASAILLLFFFNFFPPEEKDIFLKPGNGKAELVMDRDSSPAQTAENQSSPVQSVDSPSSEGQTNPHRIEIKLALSLTTQDEAVPIPSQNASYGNSLIGSTPDDIYLWQTDNDKKTEKRVISPDEVNLKIDEIVLSVEGKESSRENDDVSGYPAHLTLEIPAVNYRRFITRLDGLGALQAPPPTLPEGSENGSVLIQMDLAPPQ